MIPGGAIYEDDLLYAGHVGTQEGQAAYLGYIMVETISTYLANEG